MFNEKTCGKAHRVAIVKKKKKKQDMMKRNFVVAP